MEISFDDYRKAILERDRWSRLCDAISNPDDRYHKMVACTKVSKKRLKKLLMASGRNRNNAEEIASWTGCVGQGRHFWYQKQIPYIIDQIDHRTAPEERFLDSIRFSLSKKYREQLRKLRAQSENDDVWEMYGKDMELLEKYPEITDEKSANVAWQAEIVANGYTYASREIKEIKSIFAWLRAANES